MTINVSNLETTILKKLNSLASTDDLLMYATAIKQLKQGTVSVVDTFSQLPVSSIIPDGSLAFVNADSTLYIYEKSMSRWVTIVQTTISSIWAWGYGVVGRLGDNTATNKSSPVSVVGGFSDWCQINAGWQHTIALRTNGTIWAWGCNTDGKLGDNSTTNRSSPVSVSGNDWNHISAGAGHNLAIKTNGTLWSWGCNTGGQLGTNNTVSSSSPVSVVGGFTDWCDISAGGCHSAAIRTDGSLWTWGCNATGRLGNNTTVNTSSPVSVVGGFTDWCQVSAGGAHTAAVRKTGTLWVWGCNTSGQLGDNTATTASKSSPVSVVGGFTNWSQVSAGDAHTTALRSGILWSWGSNCCGQLGHGTATTCSRSSPVIVVGGFTDWCQVSANGFTSAAVRTNGTLWVWGVGVCGPIGDNTVVAKSSPASVVGGFTDWSQVSAGGTCFVVGLKATTI